MRESRLTLPDGRQLAYALAGRGGPATLWFHGSNMGRLDARFFELRGEPSGTVVAVDRPGHGGSTRQRARTLRSHSQDAAALADHLGIGEFAVLGYSMGVPYAYAAARHLGERVLAVGALTGLSPPHEGDGWAWLGPPRPLFEFARDNGADALEAVLHPGFADPAVLLDELVASLPPATASRLGAVPGCIDALRASAGDSVRNGPGGFADDHAVIAAPWRFTLAEVSQPTIVWHGEDDALVPAETVEYQARTVPNATLRRKHGFGHLDWLTQLPRLVEELHSPLA